MSKMARVVPMLYFAAAHASLAAACAAVLWSPRAVAGFFYHARMVGIVHLVTLGWITFSILGAVYIVGPMALRMSLPPRKMDAVAFGAASVGLAGMVGHFWIEDFAGMAWSASMVAAAVLIVAARVLRALPAATIPPAVKLHIGLACLNIYLAAAAGVLLAFDKVHHFLPGFVIANVFAHAHLAAVGWAGMLVVGIGYRMLPMTLPSKMPSGRSIYASAILLEGGVLGLFAALVTRGAWAWVAGATIVAGFAVFGGHVIWMVRSPAPKPVGAPRIDFGVLHAAAAGLSLLVSCVVGLSIAAAPPSPWTLQAASLYGVVGIVGFLAQMVVAVQVRLVPMFAWYWSFARSEGLIVPPPPLAARDRTLQALTFAGWTIGVPALAMGMLRMSAPAVAVGAAALLAGVLLAAVDNAFVLAAAFRAAPAVRPLRGALRIVPIAGLVIACVGRAGPAAAQVPASLEPPGWDAGAALSEAHDRNPDPKTVEIDLTARIAEVEVAPGATVRAWTYDGHIPGPLIRAHVGDRLIVHFTNRLEQPTTIHWHGVRVPIEMDGVPDVSQPEVKPGETFTYDFVLRDAALYWYHPHVMSAAQVGFGLYGALLVEDPNDGVNVVDQLTIVLSDIGFDRKGVLDSADTGGPAGMVFGREGAYVLANGRVKPTLRVRSGAPQRWRIVNTAKSRYFLLELDDQPFYVIGGDGGLQEAPETKSSLLITPGERADVIVTPTRGAEPTLTLRAMLYNRGYGSVEFRNNEDVLTIAFTDEPTLPPATLPAVHRDIPIPSVEGATDVPIVLTLPPAGAGGKSEFRVNGVPFWKAKPYMARIGEKQIWTVKNDSKFAHPFHLHGFFFLPLDANLRPIHPMVWKDTLNVPIDATVRFLVVFDERPGMWMFHCHILDHADGGLMGHVHLTAGTQSLR
jgi:FtsP/CotA-like multicopper oxidase with cupredoxin domain